MYVLIVIEHTFNVCDDNIVSASFQSFFLFLYHYICYIWYHYNLLTAAVS